MGTDCVVKIGDKYTELDRWYVFDSVMKSKKPMTKNEALAKIKKLLNKKHLIEQTKYCKHYRLYYKHWLLVAKKAIRSAKPNDTITFYNEHDLPDLYWEWQK